MHIMHTINVILLLYLHIKNTMYFLERNIKKGLIKMRVYYDRDADVNLVKEKKIAIAGYGSQGHAHALNLRDSGIKDISIVLRPGSASANKAKNDGFNVLEAQDAAKNAAMLIERLHQYPLIYNEVKVAIRVSQRRWNLRLKNNIEIRLPAENISTALNQLSEYQNKHSLFDRNIIAVDMRVPDRLIVRVNNQEKKFKKVIGENT